MDKIAVFIPDEEARKFLLFQQYFEPINIIIEAGVFTIRNGSARLNFDNEGKLSSIDRADSLFSRRHLH